MNIKKITAFMAALTVTLSLAACGSGSSEITADTEAAQAAVTETVNDGTDAETESTDAPDETEAEETTESTAETTVSETEETEPEEQGYQPPDWDSIDYADELDFMTEDVDGGVAVTAYLGTDTVLKIPETIDGKAVTEIKYTYEYYGTFREITDIKLPSGMKKIGNDVFYCCNNLRSVDVPEGVTSIGAHAFDGCFSLEYFVIPESVTEIGVGALAGSIFKSITIPNGVEKIGYNAFVNCPNLTELTFPEGVVFTDDFESNVTIDRRQRIYVSHGEYIFLDIRGCSSLKRFDVPDGVTAIGGEQPSWNNDIGFVGCENIEEITLPDSLIYIGSNTFRDCKLLKSISIPDSVTYIGYAAFNGCKSLKSIDIPDSVNLIAYGAFEGLSDDLEVTYKGTTYKYHQLPHLYKLFEE